MTIIMTIVIIIIIIIMSAVEYRTLGDSTVGRQYSDDRESTLLQYRTLEWNATV